MMNNDGESLQEFAATIDNLAHSAHTDQPEHILFYFINTLDTSNIWIHIRTTTL
jgi:hypothetical protein